MKQKERKEGRRPNRYTLAGLTKVKMGRKDAQNEGKELSEEKQNPG